MAEHHFVKWMLTDEAEELLKYPDGHALLSLIARRARRQGSFATDGLEAGEALIGDYESCGLSMRRYRTAKEKLEKWGFATFRATNKGTIAKLMNTMVFDVSWDRSDKQSDKPATSQRQPSDNPATTNRDIEREESKREEIYRPACSLDSILGEERFRSLAEDGDFVGRFGKWVRAREEKERALSAAEIEANLEEALRLGPAEAGERLRVALLNGWNTWAHDNSGRGRGEEDEAADERVRFCSAFIGRRPAARN